MREYKKDWGPDFRFFKCNECDHEWKNPSRDWTSPSIESCPNMEIETCEFGIGYYEGGEPHYEWETDSSGNLIEGKKYE